MALSPQLYGTETWAMMKKGENKIQAQCFSDFTELETEKDINERIK